MKNEYKQNRMKGFKYKKNTYLICYNFVAEDVCLFQQWKKPLFSKNLMYLFTLCKFKIVPLLYQKTSYTNIDSACQVSTLLLNSYYY